MNAMKTMTLHTLRDTRIFGTKNMAFRDKKIRQYGEKEKITGITKICAWCGKSLASLPDQATKHISHGICLACAEGFFLKSGLDTRRIFHE
jgi:hypothetical protein